MKIDSVKKKKEVISLVLLWFSVVLGVLIIVKVAGFFVATARAEKLIADALAYSQLDPNDTEKYLAKSKSVADELKKKNVFAPPPPKKHPVQQVSGILGKEVLIGDKWYKVGDKVGDAKIVAIEPTQVWVEWDGEKKAFAPISSATSATEKRKVKKTAVKKPDEAPKEVNKTVEEVKPTVEEDPLGWMGVKLSPALRAKLLEQWNKASDEEKAKAKEEWNKKSDEEKQQAIDQLEQSV